MKSGLLRKKSSGWFPRWQTRHVSHSPEKLLTVKRNADSSRCRVFIVSSANRGKDETELSVICHDGRVLILRSRTKSEREDWIVALTFVPTPDVLTPTEGNLQASSQLRPAVSDSNSSSRINGSVDHSQLGFPHPSKSTAVEPPNSLISSGREFRIKLYEQGQFIGEFVEGVRHGMGRFEYTNGNLYTGAWQNDLKYGFGTLQWANNDVYTGEWKDNKMWGYGQYQYSDGNSYTGCFVADHKHGPGRFSWVLGDAYEGEWAHDEMHGGGVMRYKSGKVYTGELQKNVKHGKGKMCWASGDSYEGEWSGDLLHGEGTFKYADRGEYNGQWFRDQRHGQGTMKLANGDMYTGQWKHDKRNGSGTCRYSNDDVYVGDFVDNLREGSGVYTSAATRMLSANGEIQDVPGDQYTGEWVGDKKHGQGRYVWSDGDVYEGHWDKDMRSHQGSCTYSNGDKYTGEWLCDQRHGFGKLVWNDGNTYEGFWRDDNIAPGAKGGARVTSGQGSSQPSPFESQKSSRAPSREPSAQPSPFHSPKSNSNPPLGHVPNLQDDSSGFDDVPQFDFARAAGEIAGTWLDTLTGARAPSHTPSHSSSPFPLPPSPHSSAPRAQLHMF